MLRKPDYFNIQTIYGWHLGGQFYLTKMSLGVPFKDNTGLDGVCA